MKKRLTAILVLSIMVVSMIVFSFAKSDFTDISGHWAEGNVDKLASEGIIDGYQDGTFKPEGTVTYAEFIKMLVVAVTGENPGVSVSGHWATEYYKLASDKKLLNENDIPKEYLDKKIPRADMAYLASKSVNEVLDNKKKELIESYIKDINTAGNRKSEVIFAYGTGILAGYPDGSFKPSGYLTRAESAAVISRIIDPNLRIEIDFTEEVETPEGSRKPMTLKFDDPNRPMAIEGDTFVKPDGTEVVLKIGPSGILGELQGVATEIGRVGGMDGKPIKHGSLGGESATDPVLGQPYWVDKKTGEGHYVREWDEISETLFKEAFKIKNPVDGQWHGDYVMYQGGQWYWAGPNGN